MGRAPQRRPTRTMDGAKLLFGGWDKLWVCVWGGAAPSCPLFKFWVPLSPPPPLRGGLWSALPLVCICLFFN